MGSLGQQPDLTSRLKLHYTNFEKDMAQKFEPKFEVQNVDTCTALNGIMIRITKFKKVELANTASEPGNTPPVKESDTLIYELNELIQTKLYRQLLSFRKFLSEFEDLKDHIFLLTCTLIRDSSFEDADSWGNAAGTAANEFKEKVQRLVDSMDSDFDMIFQTKLRNIQERFEEKVGSGYNRDDKGIELSPSVVEAVRLAWKRLKLLREFWLEESERVYSTCHVPSWSSTSEETRMLYSRFTPEPSERYLKRKKSKEPEPKPEPEPEKSESGISDSFEMITKPE